jgi:hypothetical protein
LRKDVAARRKNAFNTRWGKELNKAAALDGKAHREAQRADELGRRMADARAPRGGDDGLIRHHKLGRGDYVARYDDFKHMNVYNPYNGKLAGRDPDPGIRFELSRDDHGG